MKHEIAVSVIIPVYNAEKTIKSLIEDILTYRKLKLFWPRHDVVGI